MARIGVLGFLHETNTFAQGTTPLERFIEADAWPGLTEGPAILEATRDMNLAVSGFIGALQEDGRHEIVPLLWCSANPSGPVADAAFEDVCDRLQGWLRDTAVDALFLDLHGSMVTESHPDAEGVLLARLREVTGPGVPYVAALDFHAILSQAMVDQTQAMVAYRSYPHVDMAETGRRAAAIMGRILAGQTFHVAWRKLDFLYSMPWQATLGDSTTAKIMKAARALESRARPEVQFIPGFPLSDTPESGPAVLCYAENAGLAHEAVDALCAQISALETEFGGRLYTIEEAVQRVRAPGAGRVILADTQDNPGGGGSGDTMGVAHALLAAECANVGVAVVCDPAFAQAAHAAGTGGRVTRSLGGHTYPGDRPLEGPFDVCALGDGRLTGTGPFYLGCRMDLGPMARVRKNGIDFLVSSRKQQAADQAMFRHLGAEPIDYTTLVLKSSVHFRADFAALAHDILVVKAPGANTADLHDLHFRNLRPGVHIL